MLQSSRFRHDYETDRGGSAAFASARTERVWATNAIAAMRESTSVSVAVTKRRRIGHADRNRMRVMA
jgi:hypothetical protein